MKNDELNAVSAARYDGEPLADGDFTDEFAALAYDTICRRLDDPDDISLIGSGIMIRKLGLSISCTLQRMGESGGNYCAEMLFMLCHELFDIPLCEYTAGFGRSPEEAVINGAEQFTSVVLLSVVAAFGCEGDHTVVTEFAGKQRVFRRSCTSITHCIGSYTHEQQELYSLVESELPAYLGSKKAYWLKLYIYRYEDTLECEARLNGDVLHELSNKLRDYALSWNDDKSFHSEKQFILMLDSDRSVEQDLIPPEKVIELAQETLCLFGTVYDEVSADEAFAEFSDLCEGYGDLKHELRALVPEIFTCRYLNIKQGDGVKLVFGNSEMLVKRSQLRNYGYIEQGVMTFIENNGMSEDFAENIMQLGSVFEAVREAFFQGARLESIYLRELTLRVPDDYVLL